MKLAGSFPRLALAATFAGLAVAPASLAAVFAEGADPTLTFANTLVDDVTPSGGGDSSVSSAFNIDRNLDIITGPTAQTLTITGIALNFRTDTSDAPQEITVNVVYFGNDGVYSASADNVDLGTRTATLDFGTTDQYTAVFDTPMTAEFIATQNRFRFNITATGSMRVKTWTAAQSPSGQGGAKLSVGGTSVVPEPGSMALVGLGGLLVAARRKPKS